MSAQFLFEERHIPEMCKVLKVGLARNEDLSHEFKDNLYMQIIQLEEWYETNKLAITDPAFQKTFGRYIDTPEGPARIDD